MADSSLPFAVTVEGVGEFLFARRTIRRQISIDVEVARLTEGVPVDKELLEFCTMLANIKCLTIQEPEDWNPNDLDPFDTASYQAVGKVWSALRDKEATFRRRPAPAPQDAGQDGGGEPGVLVPSQVQPPADG